jgi:hypothetical protein
LSAGGNQGADHEHGAASARLPAQLPSKTKDETKATTKANPDNDEDDLGGYVL